MADAVAGQGRRLAASVARFFATPLTPDPLERSLSGRVGGILWIAGGCVVLAPALVNRSPGGSLPLGAAVAVGLLAMVWGGMSLRVLDWVNGPAWLGHLTAAGGLVAVATVVYLSGGARSTGWQEFTWLVLFGCVFFRSAVRRWAKGAADVDSVTGVANHRQMDRALHEHAARSCQTGARFALAVLDVDHLTHIKELYGQTEVEQALRDLAAAISKQARPGDVIARTGSDEFSWLMPDLTAQAAQNRVESVRRLLDPAAAGGVQFSAGIVDSSVAVDPPALMRLAGGALYWSKVQGRAQSRIYEPEVMAALSADERTERLRRSQALIGLLALARAIDAKDPATREHSERVAALAEALARIVGWDDADARALRDAALVHDVGKIGVDDAILRKPTALTPAEREQVNAHAEISGRIVDGVLGAEQVEWIRTHHERVDGSGYPNGLGGQQIPLGGALLAIADAFDAMTAGRRYSAPRDPTDALAECRAQIGRHFRREAVAALEVWLTSGAAFADPTQTDADGVPLAVTVSEGSVATKSLVSGHGPGPEH